MNDNADPPGTTPERRVFALVTTSARFRAVRCRLACGPEIGLDVPRGPGRRRGLVIAWRDFGGPGRMRPVDIIRRATSADEDLMLVLIGEFYVIDQHPFDRERGLRGLRPLLADDRFGQAWLIGPPCGPPIGYAVVTWSWSLESGGRDCILDELYVRDRGQGIGARAMPEIMAAAHAVGAAAIFLETEVHNTRARAFYQRCGFTAEESVWMARALP